MNSMLQSGNRRINWFTNLLVRRWMTFAAVEGRAVRKKKKRDFFFFF